MIKVKIPRLSIVKPCQLIKFQSKENFRCYTAKNDLSSNLSKSLNRSNKERVSFIISVSLGEIEKVRFPEKPPYQGNCIGESG